METRISHLNSFLSFHSSSPPCEFIFMQIDIPNAVLQIAALFFTEPQRPEI